MELVLPRQQQWKNLWALRVRLLKDLIIFGAGGFGREVAWAIDRINKVNPTWNLLGFIDDNEEIQGTVIDGNRVLGRSEDILSFPDAYIVCAVGASRTREIIIGNLKRINPHIHFGTVIDPSVAMSDTVSIGEGTIICANNIITVNITIGCHVIINLACTIGHDSVLGDFATLYPTVNVSGMTTIGRATEIGTGTQIIQGKKIGDYSVAGAGAVIVSDIKENSLAVGCPAKVIKTY